jgi:hypothetical protein
MGWEIVEADEAVLTAVRAELKNIKVTRVSPSLARPIPHCIHADFSCKESDEGWAARGMRQILILRSDALSRVMCMPRREGDAGGRLGRWTADPARWMLMRSRSGFLWMAM